MQNLHNTYHQASYRKHPAQNCHAQGNAGQGGYASAQRGSGQAACGAPQAAATHTAVAAASAAPSTPRKTHHLARIVAVALVALVISSVFAVSAFSKYVLTQSATAELQLTVSEYTINKSKMHTVMQSLATKPTTVKFVTGTSVPAGLTNLATTTVLSSTTAGIQEDDSSMIGVFQSGTTLYIAPMNTPAASDTTGAAATAANNTAVMYAPADSSAFMRGGVIAGKDTDDDSYTGLVYSLEEIDFANLDTTRVEKLNEAFSRLAKLTTLTNFNKVTTANVTNMSDMFFSAIALTSVDVSGFNTSKVTDMSYMFQSCSELTSISGLENFNTTNVTNMAAMFQYCPALESLNLSSFNTSKITNMNIMFTGCYKLAEVTLGKDFVWLNGTSTGGPLPTPSSSYIAGATGMWYDTTTGDDYTPTTLAGVTRTETRTYTAVPGYYIDKTKMWAQLKALSNKPSALKFVKGNDSNVTSLTNLYSAGIQDNTKQSGKIAIYQSSDNSTVYIAPADKTNSINAMYTPEDCAYFLDGSSSYTNLGSNLTTIDCTNLDTSKTTAMNVMFYRQNAAKTINVSSFDTGKVTNMAGMFSECWALENISVTNFSTSNVTGMQNLFRSNKALKSIDLSSFDTSKVTTMYAMFINCEALTSLDLSNFNTAKVSTMESMFDTCKALTSLDVSSFTGSAVTTTYRMFYDCSVLPTITLTNFETTSALNTTASMFAGCNALTSLTLSSSFNTSGVTTMASMFSNCGVLPSVNVSMFNTANVENMQGMFFQCYKLASLDVSNFNTSKVTAMATMFYKDSSLTNLNLSNFNTGAVTTMVNMFNGCSGLTSLDVSSFTGTSLTSMTGMFSGCSSLTSLDLSNFNTPNYTSTNFANGPFTGCSKLQSITLSGDFKFMPASSSTTSATSYLPTPSSTYITGADGNWYDTVTGTGYTPANQATYHNNLNATRTYVAVFKTYTIDKSKMWAALTALTTKPSTINFVKGSEVPSGATNMYTAGIQDSSSTGTIGVFQSGSTVYIAPTESYDGWSRLYAPTECFEFLDLKSHAGFTNYTLETVDLSNLDTSKVTSNMGWFFEYNRALTSIKFGEYFDTSNVTGMFGMFHQCSALTELDISMFNTAKVTGMRCMFDQCTNLKTIYVSSSFVTTNVTSSDTMFTSSTKLVGGKGTTYNESYLDKTYARIDGGTSSPGYFTEKSQREGQQLFSAII